MGSVRRRDDRVRVSLEAGEVVLVQVMATRVLELLGGGPAMPDGGDGLQQLLDSALDPVETPRDPVLLRLLPDAYRDDDEATAEFRRLTEADLRATKHGRLGQLVADLDATGVQQRGGVRLDLEPDQAAAWLEALNDIRLTLGTQIGVTEDMDEERETLPVDSPRYAEIVTYDWFSWLQDALVRAVAGD
jgi:Domain of unknown function (DUF2017)